MFYINFHSFQSLSSEKAMAPHSSTLAWKIPWTEEPGGLQSMGLLRVGHDWATSLSLFTFMHWRRKWQPLQCSCLENPRDGGAWWAAVYGVAQSQTRLKWLSSSSRVFPNFPVTSSLTHCLFRMLGHVDVFMNFPNFLLLLISNFIPLVREYTLYNFNPFKFVEACFMT